MSEATPPDQDRRPAPLDTRQPWEAMRLTYLGNAADLLQSSQGKMSRPSFDPGDARQVKQRGQS